MAPSSPPIDTASPSHSNETTKGKRLRRSHHKTRNGCDECRRRHIRCDKGRPACHNCVNGQRSCEFPDALKFKAPKISTPSTSESQQRNGLHGSPWTTSDLGASPNKTDSPIHAICPLTASCVTPVLGLQSTRFVDQPALSFSVTDLLVFNHAETDMAHNGIGPPGHLQRVVALALRNQTRAPYLLDQILAFAAMHLSVHLPPAFSTDNSTPVTQVSPTSSSPFPSLLTGQSTEKLRLHSTFLQTRALNAFSRSIQNQEQRQQHEQTLGIRPESNIADADADDELRLVRFMFAGLLSLHALAQTFGALCAHELQFHALIDQCVDCFNLHRGLPVVIGRSMHDFLNTAEEVRPMFEALNIFAMPNQAEGTDCDALGEMLKDSDLSEASLEACRSAQKSLQRSFDLFNILPVHNVPHAASTFATTVPEAYVALLRKRSSEAFVILAYYGALVHRCRRYWAFGDAGALIVKAIAEHLGTYWADVLAWPLHVIENERD